jgi:hypothetical protein
VAGSVASAEALMGGSRCADLPVIDQNGRIVDVARDADRERSRRDKEIVADELRRADERARRIFAGTYEQATWAAPLP